MGGCSATGCSSRNEKGKKLHCFPRDPVRREIWEKMVGRRNWKAHDRSRLCEDHFEESQYESRRMDNLRKLKPNAIPTKFTHFKKNKTLRQIVENLTKTLVQSPLPERHSVEHSYSQSSEKGPSEKEDSGDVLFSIDDSPGENILKPESFGLPLHCVFLCPLDDEDLTSAQCETSVELQSKVAEERRESTGPVEQNPPPMDSANSADCEIAHLKDIIRKKDERIAMLLKAVVSERREKHKLEREKQNLIQNIEKVFNANQLARLGRKSGRGVKWSSETMEKARQLRATCGVKGYMLLRAQNQPLPSLRCLRKLTPMKKKRLEQDTTAAGQATTAAVDCLQATIGVDDVYVDMVMQ
ncbi:uncharacterized protein LOC115359502 isoform X1 [Myripristis murdjan]|uniref:uncharacterized protein LOC115359502 isoform X1 n=1 Tax=Myripristis murdjan TaxID=586833 RepID=UPI0011763ABA|nr:uncharacterized protein LOC115359502 isoform X1 [Myripristis murdjan]